MHITRHWTTLVMMVALLVTVIAGVVTGPALAGSQQPATTQGDKCVAPTEWMRRNHMSALKHQRNETVHKGIRTPKFSLNGCINCHQVKGADGKPVTVSDPKHFCRTCHDYAAVRLDCFECHASRPEATTKTGSAMEDPHAATTAGDVATLNRYLEEASR